MKDIAREAGVAQSTVSRILNDTELSIPISETTRERVLAIADAFGYRPHPLARALRGAPTMLLGVIVRDITDPFFATAIDHLTIEAKSHGYSVVLGHARKRAEEAYELAAVLEARSCDAIVLFGDLRDQPRLVAELKTADVPVVAMWYGSHESGFSSINVDNAGGVTQALDHLTTLGHTRIAFVGERSLGDIADRQAAYESYLVDAGIEMARGYVHHVPNTPAGGAQALRRLMELPEPPTAVLAATDTRALGVLYAAYELGVAVPAGLSVVGFDDIPLSEFSVPPLTTVRMPTLPMVSAAVELAIGSGRTVGSDSVSRTFEPALEVRRSTGSPRLSTRP